MDGNINITDFNIIQQIQKAILSPEYYYVLIPAFFMKKLFVSKAVTFYF